VIGATLGSYRVVRKLDEGGMGVLYEAQHQVLGKRVVVKTLRDELATNAEVVARFFNEARATAQLRHEGIVEILDFGYDAQGTAYIVMEYLDGESLASRLRREGRLPFELAAAIGRQAAAAVHAAHARGIVHRDLKPDNLYLVHDRELTHGVRVKVLDFGIAKLLDGDVAADVRTRTGAVLGTPFYMSPEQCRGGQQIDNRSDVYSLGCILYEMACGHPPFRAAGLGDLIVMHVTEPPRPPSSLVPGVPPAFEAAVMRALAKRPWERQQSAEQLAAELADVRSGAGAGPGAPPIAYQPTGQAMPPQLPHITTGPRPVPERKPRGRGLAIGIAVAVVAAVASLVTYAVVTKGPESGAGTGSATGSGTVAGSGSACGSAEACMAAAAALPPGEALAILDPLCRGGHAPACNRAGLVVGGGTGGARDLARMAVYYQLACDRKDSEGCFRLGAVYYNGEGVARDVVRGAALLETACIEHGVAEACGVLGSAYQDGETGLPADPAKAAALGEKACEAGLLPACTNLGFQLEVGNGVARDLARAKELYERACSQVSPKACENLCMVYVFGKGVPHDEVAALPHCRKSCDFGNASGCTWTGYIYIRDKGVPPDGGQAMAYFDQACTRGDMKGCFAAGVTLQQGGVVERDFPRAIEFYEKACASNVSPDACTNLGNLVADGRGTKADPARGLQLFESGCGGGDALGCFKVGRYYHFGFGVVKKDRARAKEYFAKACRISAAMCGKSPDDE
jgi:TPR repeat protein/tRNA A-37 threonylcarbamoyl transferase component Bud32